MKKYAVVQLLQVLRGTEHTTDSDRNSPRSNRGATAAIRGACSILTLRDVANDAAVYRRSNSVVLPFCNAPAHFFLMFLQICHEHHRCSVYCRVFWTEVFIAVSASVMMTYRHTSQRMRR